MNGERYHLDITEDGHWSRTGVDYGPRSKCIVFRRLSVGNGFLILRVAGHTSWAPRGTKYHSGTYLLVHIVGSLDGGRSVDVEEIERVSPGKEWRPAVKALEARAYSIAAG